MSQPIRYFDRQKEQLELAEIEAARNRKDTRHVDFLMQRRAERQAKEEVERQHMHPDDVAELTTRMLRGKAEVYFHQLTSWRPLLNLRRFDRVKLIDNVPHLGFASVTCGTTPGQDGVVFPWVFYYSNFKAKFGTGDILFEEIPKAYGITFFGIAFTTNRDGSIGGRDLSKRGNGILFSTQDPGEAFENVSRLCDMKKLWNALTRLPR